MSYSPTPHLMKVIGRGLEEIVNITPIEDGVRVTTHCMYPSNGLVQVTIRGGIEKIMASDEGGAIGEALAAGIPMRDLDKTLNHLIKDQGLRLKKGTIFTPPMPIEAAPLAILLVANASQEVARWLYEHMKIKRTRDFKVLLSEFLQNKFDAHVAHNAVIVGHSNKPHRFANVISLGEARIIIDPVTNEASSINARVVANLDVRATENPNIVQRIIYDDEEDWAPADLNLLQVGAPVIAFSRASEAIERITGRIQSS
jgi:hypothetical protein